MALTYLRVYFSPMWTCSHASAVTSSKHGSPGPVSRSDYTYTYTLTYTYDSCNGALLLRAKLNVCMTSYVSESDASPVPLYLVLVELCLLLLRW